MIGVVRGIVDGFNLRAAHATPAVRLSSQRVEAQSLDYVDLLVPGLLAMAIAQSAAFGVAFSLVAWRQKGMLRRLRLTPLPLVEFATARVIFHLMIVARAGGDPAHDRARAVRRAPRRQRRSALMPLILLGGVAFIALGMCIGGRVNSEDATAALSNLIVLPMTFLGGVFFPLSSAPAPVRLIAHFLPLTYLAQGLQDVAVRGHSFTSTLPNLGVLALVALLLSGLALRLFRWQTTVTSDPLEVRTPPTSARCSRIRGSSYRPRRPPMPPASVAWLRASVGRFCNGETHRPPSRARDRPTSSGSTSRICARTRARTRPRCSRCNGRKPFDADGARRAAGGGRRPRGRARDRRRRRRRRRARRPAPTPSAASAHKQDGARGRAARRGLRRRGRRGHGRAHRAARAGLRRDRRAGRQRPHRAAQRARAAARPEELVAATLRDDPPVRSTRRVAEAPARIGEAEHRRRHDRRARSDRGPRRASCRSGPGPRSCPGREQALALAAGIVEACTRLRLAESEIDYLPAAANLRAPSSLMLVK